MPISLLLLDLDIWHVKPTYRKSWGWESSDVVSFDLGPLLQGQTRIAKCKSAYSMLIIGLIGMQCETNIYVHEYVYEFIGRESSADLMCSDLTRIPPSRYNEDSQT